MSSHTIQLSNPNSGVVDHTKFFGRRNAGPTRHVGYSYGIFRSQAAAEAYSEVDFRDVPFDRSDLLASTGPFGSRREFMDQFFLDGESYSMDDASNFAHLQRLLTGNFTAAEFADTFGLQEARTVLEGAQFVVNGVVAFTVEALPAQRLPENE